MKIPDEVEFAKLRKKPLLDTRGWVTCLHCIFCRLTTQNQIYDDGEFYCVFLGKWKDADDLIEYRCQGFRVKKCSLCSKYQYCKDKDKALFCNKFVYKKNRNLIKGRKKPLPQKANIVHILAEEQYVEKKRMQEKEYLLDIKDTDYT